jgi:hypothetical protein
MNSSDFAACMMDVRNLLDELPGGSKDAGRMAQDATQRREKREERRKKKRISIFIAMIAMKEQQRARHCALGLNAYTHRDRETRPICFLNGIRARALCPFSFSLQSDPVPNLDLHVPWIFWNHSFRFSFSILLILLLLPLLLIFSSSSYLVLTDLSPLFYFVMAAEDGRWVQHFHPFPFLFVRGWLILLLLDRKRRGGCLLDCTGIGD